MASNTKPKFGHEMRHHFCFREDWINLNHGAYGSYPKQVGEARAEFLGKIEQAPDPFLRYEHLTLLDESCKRLAEYLSVPADEIVLVENATMGMSTALRNLTFNDKDVVVYFDSIYDAIESTLLSIQETSPQVRLHKVDYGDDSSKAEYAKDHNGICESFTQTVSKLQAEGYTVKAAVFETISSIPAVRLPFERLTRLCRENGILSVIDGAHGIGQIPLNLSKLDADFFISNCHKWLYVPRGCAVFHVPKRNQHLVRTAFPTSWEFELKSKGADSSNRFLKQFQNQATADYTPFYCIPAALDVRERVFGGETAIFEYSKGMAQRGADIVAKALGTSVLQEPSDGRQNGGHDGKPSSNYSGLRDCALSNVLMPLAVNDSNYSQTNSITLQNMGQVSGWLERTLPARYTTSLSFFTFRGRIWVRFCGQIYLELTDFEWVADILLDLCKRVNAGEPFMEKKSGD